MIKNINIFLKYPKAFYYFFSLFLSCSDMITLIFPMCSTACCMAQILLTVHTLPTLDLLIYITTDGCQTTIRFCTNMRTIRAIRQIKFLNVSEILVSVFHYSKIDQAFSQCLIFFQVLHQNIFNWLSKNNLEPTVKQSPCFSLICRCLIKIQVLKKLKLCEMVCFSPSHRKHANMSLEGLVSNFQKNQISSKLMVKKEEISNNGYSFYFSLFLLSFLL